MDTHAGAILEKVVRNSGISIAELARRVRVDRRSLYNWFEQKKLKYEVVAKVGYVLGYDFSKEFPEFRFQAPLMEKNNISFGIKDETSEESEYWKSKYISLLEKYSELLSRQEVLSEESAA
jgi:lambda repressor-like predicted transcriptional regulator